MYIYIYKYIYMHIYIYMLERKLSVRNGSWILRFSFSPGRDRACRHRWISFFLNLLGKTTTIVFVRTPVDIRKYLTKGFFYLFNKDDGNSSFSFFFCLPPADAGDGEAGGDHLEPFGTIWEHFRFILDSV